MKADKTRIYSDVEFLTEIMPPRNYKNLESLNKVVNYIQNEFKKIGDSVKIQTWMADGNEYSNVIVRYNSSNPRKLIVGAHYDVCGDQPGADDNASAVAGLLETARLVFSNQPQLDYCIEFVAYCLEEPPYFDTDYMGSYIHAQSLFNNNTDVIGMICYEMIGYFSDEPNSQPFPLPGLAEMYPSVANFIIVVGIEAYEGFNNRFHKLMSKGSGIDVQVISFPHADGLAGLSDHSNYWKFGYPALMINDTSFVRNPNYHQESDTIETLDFPKMVEVIDSSYRAITSLTV